MRPAADQSPMGSSTRLTDATETPPRHRSHPRPNPFVESASDRVPARRIDYSGYCSTGLDSVESRADCNSKFGVTCSVSLRVTRVTVIPLPRRPVTLASSWCNRMRRLADPRSSRSDSSSVARVMHRSVNRVHAPQSLPRSTAPHRHHRADTCERCERGSNHSRRHT